MAMFQKTQGVTEAVSAQEAQAYNPPDTQLVHTVLSNLSRQIVQLTPRAGAFAENCLRTLVLLQARLSCGGTEAVEKHDELVVTPRAFRGRSVQEPDEEPSLSKQASAKWRSQSAAKRLHTELPHRWSPQQLKACESILVDLERCRMEMEDHRSCLTWSSLSSPLCSLPVLSLPVLALPTERPRSLPPHAVAEPPSPREMPAPGRLTLPRNGTARHSPEYPAPAKRCKDTVARSKSAAVARHKRSSGRTRRTSSEAEAARALEKARALLSDMLTQCADDDSIHGKGNCSITEAMREVQQQSSRRHSSVPRHCVSPTNAAGHCLVSSSPGYCDAGALQPLNDCMLGVYLGQSEGRTSQRPS